MKDYVKVNPKVAKFLGVAGKRPVFPDGNILLWKFDLLPIGGNTESVLKRIGAVAFTATECRDEQKSVAVTPLPVAEDEQFRMENENMEE